MGFFSQPGSLLYIPDQSPVDTALPRTTHLGIGAHPDDLETIAISGILESYHSADHYFTGVITTNGAGSPRSGPYKNTPNQEMVDIRKSEQKKAARLGQYNAQIMLDFPSDYIKQGNPANLIADLKNIISRSTPDIIYTHNLFDRHPTHVATAVRVLQALQSLPANIQPQRILGVEFWRDLDWLSDDEKIVLDCSRNLPLQRDLLQVFQSQNKAGKRYDRAVIARRRAHATLHSSHDVDQAKCLVYAVDLTPLMGPTGPSLKAYISDKISKFQQDVVRLIPSQ